MGIRAQVIIHAVVVECMFFTRMYVSLVSSYIFCSFLFFDMIFLLFFFRFSYFNHLISLPLHRLFIMFYTCTHFFLFLEIYIKPIENLCFSDFSSIFSLNLGKKCIRQAAFVYLLFQICQCMHTWMFYLSFICKEIEQVAIERNGCQTDFFFLLHLFCLFFSFVIWNIKSMIHHHPIWLITQSYCQHIQQQNRLIFHIHVVANVCCTATRSAALLYLNSWLCQYS